MPVITLPDGSQRTYAEPISVEKVAADIGPGLAKAALAGKVDGKLVDTSYVIDRDARLAIVTDQATRRGSKSSAIPPRTCSRRP